MRKEIKILRFVPQKLRKSFANGNPISAVAYNSASLTKKNKKRKKGSFFIDLLHIILFYSKDLYTSSPFRHKTGKRRSLEEI